MTIAPATLAVVPHTPMLLAHQGGWDEVAFVLVPIAAFAALLAVANRRATRQQDEGRDADPSADGPDNR